MFSPSTVSFICLFPVCKLNYSFCSLPSFTSLWYEGLILYAGESACLPESAREHMLQDVLMPCSSASLTGPLEGSLWTYAGMTIDYSVHQSISASYWVDCSMIQECYHEPTETFTPGSDSYTVCVQNGLFLSKKSHFKEKL